MNSSNKYYRGQIMPEEIKANFKIKVWILEQLIADIPTIHVVFKYEHSIRKIKWN